MCLRPIKRRLERSRVNLIKNLSGLHIRPFRKQPLLDDTVHLGTNFSYQKSAGTPRQFIGDGHFFRL
ncbi:MAG: hypothetical protein BWY42_01770 [Candidatus Omnitrophica bacterium ADurb.Bin277]|nr:MAG: hypothetical protein BWY42_01770 [Candidatus Omnitrophica bacterium ADurb.Bin277]